MKKRSDLKEYQKKFIEFGKNKKKCGLFLDVGVGKTVISMTIASDCIRENKNVKVLVLAPLEVVKDNWCAQGEITNWDHLKHHKAVACLGSPAQRKRALDSDADFYAINFENVSWLQQTYSLKKWKWNFLIVDESSFLKSSSSKRFKALKKTLTKYNNVLLLSGTPFANSLDALWPQLYILDQGERLLKTKTAFYAEYFQPRHAFSFAFAKPVPRAGAKEQIMDKIKDICVWYTLEGEDKLEDATHIFRKILMPEDAKKNYEKLKKELSVQIQSNTITSESLVHNLDRLLQISNGFVYTEEKEAIEIHKEKIYCLEDILKEYPEDRFLVAYNYKADKEALRSSFKEAVFLTEHKDNLKKWNRGEIKMLCCHPRTAAFGLNAQFGGSVVIWFGLTYSLELYNQFNARLHRRGQKKPVKIIHIIAENGLDPRVVDILGGKSETEKECLSILRANLS